MLARLAVASYRHRRRVLAIWVALLSVLTVGSMAVGKHWMTNMTLPNTDAAKAAHVLDTAFPSRSGDPAAAVVCTPHGASSPATTASLAGFEAVLRHTPGVAGVDAPVVARDGKVVMVPFTFTAKGQSTKAAAARVSGLAQLERRHGLDVELSGPAFQTGSLGMGEVIGIVTAAIILVLAFGSVVAMGLPIVTALFGIAIASAGVEFWSHVVATPDFTTQVASMIGIGVGIDYALFILTRYKDALARLGDHESAVVEAITTAGRAVLFAGAVVVVALLGMILMRLDFVGGLAIGSSTAVAVAVAAALTLLPALLGFAGDKINRLSIHRRDRVGRESLWHRWATFLQRHPWPAAVGGAALLVVLALPTLGMRLGFLDAGNDAAGHTTRVSYDLVAKGFGPGANGPLYVVAELHGASATSRFVQVDAALQRQPGVVEVLPPVFNASHTVGVIRVLPTTAPESTRTVGLIEHLRHDVLTRYTGADLGVQVGGPTAAGIDYSTIVSHRLPVFIGAVLVLSFLLLMAVFRSVLLPLKAVVMNLLSIGSAFGVMVAMYQWGWGLGLVGGGHGGPIEPWIPMMLFAIVFGLSMDYEVFLLSSIREEYDSSGDTSRAVVEGLASTGRVITAAAAIMVTVFAGFVLGDIRAVKVIGTGLAAAVLVDAVVVRCILVPATMELLGRWNWWLPTRLARVLPRLTVEPAGGPVLRPGPEPRPEPVPLAA